MSPNRAAVVVLITLIGAACGPSTDTTPDPTTSPSTAGTSVSTVASTSTTTAPVPTSQVDGTEAFVVHVDDGDSIIVEIDGAEERVRLIGINAPEQGECLGDGSRQNLVDLVDGALVILEADEEDRDDFDRLLRYVYVDGVMANRAQVAAGLAISRTFEPNTAHQRDLDRAQERAQSEAVGLWASEACGTGTAGVEIGILAIQSDPPGRDEDNLNGEFVIFESLADTDTDMGGFVLRDGTSRNRYVFPEGFVVPPDGRFVVYVGCGEDTSTELYWCADGPVWSNNGDEVFLTDPAGNIVVYKAY